jgi:hypothetical protein
VRRCTEHLTRAALITIVEGVLAAMWPPGRIDRPWSRQTHDAVAGAIGRALADAWQDEVEHEKGPPRPRLEAVEAPATLDTSDRAALTRWADDLRAALAEVDRVIEDALRPPRGRELGPVLHGRQYAEGRAKVLGLLAAFDAA